MTTIHYPMPDEIRSSMDGSLARIKAIEAMWLAEQKTLASLGLALEGAYERISKGVPNGVYEKENPSEFGMDWKPGPS